MRGSYDDCSRLVVELPVRSTGHSSTSGSARTTRRGRRRSRSRSPSSSAGASRRRHRAVASGSLFTKIRQGFELFEPARSRRGRAAAHLRRPGGRCSPSQTRSRTSGRCRRSVRRRSCGRSRSAVPPTATSRSRPRARRAARSTPCRRTAVGPYMSLLADDRRLRRDRRRRHRRRLRAAAPAAALGERRPRRPARHRQRTEDAGCSTTAAGSRSKPTSTSCWQGSGSQHESSRRVPAG